MINFAYPNHPSLGYYNVYPLFLWGCGLKNMAAQGWLRTMQSSMNYIWRTANIRGPSCIKAKVLGIQECRRTFITSIVRQGEKMVTSTSLYNVDDLLESWYSSLWSRAWKPCWIFGATKWTCVVISSILQLWYRWGNRIFRWSCLYLCTFIIIIMVFVYLFVWY